MRLDEAATGSWLRTVAVAALCVVGVLAVVAYLLRGLLVPLRALGQSVVCAGNVFRLTRAFRMYSDDYDERFPPAPGWVDRTLFYTGDDRRYHCPVVSAPGEDRYGYAMNDSMSARFRSKVNDPDHAPIVYDSESLVRSAHDALTSLPYPGRHFVRAQKRAPLERGNFIGYVAGFAKFAPESAKRPIRSD
ncbi:MAG: hypothetical protein ACP5VE_13415 [Chthonomonadales bacterium]